MLNLLNKTKTWLTASIFAATAASTQQNTSRAYTSEQGHAMSKSQMMPIYSAPARFDVRNSWNLYTSGKFLYWQAREENLEIGIITRNDPEGIIPGSGDRPFATSYLNTMNVTTPHFTYRPGVKIGVGANLNHDNWDACAEYTWFHSTIATGITPLPRNTATSVPLNGEYLIPIQGASGTLHSVSDAYFYFQDANQSWNLKMDLLDVSLARSYYEGTKLTLRPFFGGRGAWIRQNLNTTINGSTEYVVISFGASEGSSNLISHNTSISWGVGPRAGFELNWLLGRGTRLIGNGAADILYTRYSLHTNEQLANQAVTDNPITANVSISQKIDYLRTHAELELGFGWGSYLNQNKWHLDLAATYGFQVFWDQNMFRNFTSGILQAKSFAPNGNLYIHGMTLSTSIHF